MPEVFDDEEIFDAPGDAEVLSLSLVAAIFLACDEKASTNTKAGRIIYQVNYLPCGKSLSPEAGRSVAKSNYAFTGYERDDALSLLDAGARMYDPTTCRFMTTDPIDHPGMSSYAYAGNNPLNFVDPDGRDRKDFSFIIDKQPLDVQLVEMQGDVVTMNIFHQTNTGEILVLNVKVDLVSNTGTIGAGLGKLENTLFHPRASLGARKFLKGKYEGTNKFLVSITDKFVGEALQLDGSVKLKWDFKIVHDMKVVPAELFEILGDSSRRELWRRGQIEQIRRMREAIHSQLGTRGAVDRFGPQYSHRRRIKGGGKGGGIAGFLIGFFFAEDEMDLIAGTPDRIGGGDLYVPRSIGGRQSSAPPATDVGLGNRIETEN